MAPRRRVVLASLAILMLGAGRAPAQEGVVVYGVVRDSAGRPVPDAEVGVLGVAARVRSDDAGRYRIPGLAAGRAAVIVRRLGYRSETRQLRLADGEQRRLDFVLGAVAQRLDAQAVVERGEIHASRLAGFNARVGRPGGHYVTRERIERANSSSVLDVLREMPGVRITGASSQGRRLRIRSATCPPLVFVDGFPASAGEFDVDMMDLRSLEGIELYAGLGSMPPEFVGTRGQERCGVIALWSRPARPRNRRPAPAPPVVVPAVAAVSEPFTQEEVDEPAIVERGTITLAYPESLYRAGTTGRVVVEFVVDTTGRVEPGSIEVLEASDARFAESARAALVGARFRPAERAGVRVRQYVQLPFGFTIDEQPAGGTARPPASR